MDNQRQGLLGAMFGNMEYMVENRDKMQRLAEEYNVLRNALGRAPSEQELGFFLNNRMLYLDPNSVARPRELGLDPSSTARFGEGGYSDRGFYGRGEVPEFLSGRSDTGFYGQGEVPEEWRGRSDTGFYGRSRAMYPDVNERALELRDQMRSLEQRAARPQDYTGAMGMDAMSRSAGGIEGLMRYNEMLRQMMPRGVR